MLRFVAEHRLVLAEHVAVLLDVSVTTAERRLRALVRTGILQHRRLFDRRPAIYQITRPGLALIGSRLPPPRLDLRSYEHDIGLGWLWLAARAGRFGALSDLVSERQMRSDDASSNRRGEPLAARLGGVGPGGRPRLHYPDLLLLTASGHRVAVELELSSKGRTRRERILAGYAGDPRIDVVLYLVERRQLGRDIAGSAARLGISRMVHVQPVVRAGGADRCSGGARVAERAASPRREAAR